MILSCFCFSPEGTFLHQPRVEGREWNERRATLGCQDRNSQTPKGWPQAPVTAAPFGANGLGGNATQGCANARKTPVCSTLG